MYRDNGYKVLCMVFSEELSKKLEECIHIKSGDQDEYRLIIQEVICNSRGGYSDESIMEDVDKGRYLHNGRECDEYRGKIDEHDRFLVKPFEVDEGVLECGKCNSNRTISYTKQTRSGDESTTVFATCYDCNNSWKI